jgi:hypothetical protein
MGADGDRPARQYGALSNHPKEIIDVIVGLGAAIYGMGPVRRGVRIGFWRQYGAQGAADRLSGPILTRGHREDRPRTGKLVETRSSRQIHLQIRYLDLGRNRS